MNESLKSMFKKEHLELAAAIGRGNGALKEKIQELFAELPDPLLSAGDVAQLLALSVEDQVKSALAELCSEQLLEQSQSTLRPLDPEGTTLFRLADRHFSRLRLPALESQLSDGTTRLQFSCDGRLIRSLAKVDRLDSLANSGNQREEVRKHVESIAAGITAGTQIPNSILLVLSAEQTVEETDDEIPASLIVIHPTSEDWITVHHPSQPELAIQTVRSVVIDFPYRRAAFDDEKSALLVDGQQRTAALSLVDIDDVPSFSLSVNAIRATAEDAKRIFQVANTTVKITTQFSRALLASMDDAPGYLRQEQARAIAAKHLALHDQTSPFYHLVQYPGVETKKLKPIIAYNSLFLVVSAFADSGLKFESPIDLAFVVGNAFNIVKKAWPTAWARKSTESKLIHGAGLRAIASLLANKVESAYQACNGNIRSTDLWDSVDASMQRLKPHVVWTDEEAAEASNVVKKIWRDQISSAQNTNQDIAALTAYLRKESLELDTKANRGSERERK
jgi:DGQHR domain-containing protein